MKLLTEQSTKLAKGEKLGYLSAVLYLDPSIEQICPKAGLCRALCLKDSGLLGLPAGQNAQRKRTELLLADRKAFEAQLAVEIERFLRKAERKGMTPCIRINGTSDLRGLAITMARRFPLVQFYDYSKIPTTRRETWPINYHVTFSHDGPGNANTCLDELGRGTSVAVCFSTKRGETLPAAWYGWPVIDGDAHDLRFLDPHGVVVGLRAKGRARKTQSGFVVQV